jgi:hypothetical protein
MDLSEISHYYICNPDVSLREEDEEGGLLFNPDTNQVKVLNNTGICIWKLCDGKHSIQSFIETIQSEFDQVPDESVEEHIREYLGELIQSGFIGEKESPVND